MKIKEAVALFRAIQGGLFNNLQGVRFNYSLKRNKDILKRELKIIEESFSPDPDFEKLEEERITLLAKFVERDDKGNPIIVDGDYKVLENNKEEFNKLFEPIKDKYYAASEGQKKRVQEYSSMIETADISFDLHYFKIPDIPEEINQEQMDLIYPLVVEG